jgi:hypothetical protein
MTEYLDVLLDAMKVLVPTDDHALRIARESLGVDKYDELVSQTAAFVHEVELRHVLGECDAPLVHFVVNVEPYLTKTCVAIMWILVALRMDTEENMESVLRIDAASKESVGIAKFANIAMLHMLQGHMQPLETALVLDCVATCSSYMDENYFANVTSHENVHNLLYFVSSLKMSDRSIGWSFKGDERVNVTLCVLKQIDRYDDVVGRFEVLDVGEEPVAEAIEQLCYSVHQIIIQHPAAKTSSVHHLRRISQLVAIIDTVTMLVDPDSDLDTLHDLVVKFDHFISSMHWI